MSLTRPVAFVGIIGMLIVSGVTMFDVLARWLFNFGILALNEIVAMTFAVTVAATLPAGLAQRVNIRIDLLESMLDDRWRARATVFGDVLLLLFFTLLALGIFDLAQSHAASNRTTIIYGWPTAPFFFCTAVLLGLSVLVQLLVTAESAYLAVFGKTNVQQPSAKLWPKVFVSAVWVVFALLAIFVTLNVDDVASFTRTHPATAVAMAAVVMWIALLALVPLAATLGLVGFVGVSLFIGASPGVSVVATESAGFLTNANIAVLPLFLMMGSFVVAAGVSEDIYRLARAILGSFRGGLALATIGGCAGFGAMTGSSIATLATFGRISLPEMRRHGYSPALAAGSVAAGGNLGALIPPSGPLILFALLTEVSIGKLFIAAIVPGALAFVFYSIAILATIRFSPGSAPPRERVETQELLTALRQASPVVLLFGTVMGGIYLGVFTATEAASVGAFSAFLLALLRGKLRISTFWRVMSETTASTALIYTLIFGGLVFTFFIEISGLPGVLTSFFSDLNAPPILTILLILALLAVLGCIMDAFAILIVTVPILTPVVVALGYDIVWWGIINLAIVELGTLTPPFGTSVFILRGFARDVPITTIFKGVLPFCAADVFKILLLVMVPAITLWLPSTMINL